MNTDELLAERQKTHGTFRDNAGCSQDLKATIRNRRTANLDEDMLEALDMICLKISRIVTGNSNEPDHWDDLAGYPKLVANRLRKMMEKSPGSVMTEDEMRKLAPTPGKSPYRFDPSHATKDQAVVRGDYNERP